MKHKDYLTNEPFKGIAKSNFELTRYAILLSRYFVKSGKEANLADILDEIRRHPDPKYLDVLKELDERDLQEERENQ